MLKKKNLWRGLTMVFALLLAVSMMAGNILELYRTSVDAFLGTRSTQTVTEQSDDESDAWTYKSEFTTAKEAYEGFKDFAIEASQETFALLKNENGALPLAKDAKITMLGVRSYAPVYGNSGGSVPDGKSTVQIFDAFTERGFQLNPGPWQLTRHSLRTRNGPSPSSAAASCRLTPRSPLTMIPTS